MGVSGVGLAISSWRLVRIRERYDAAPGVYVRLQQKHLALHSIEHRPANRVDIESISTRYFGRSARCADHFQRGRRRARVHQPNRIL